MAPFRLWNPLLGIAFVLVRLGFLSGLTLDRWAENTYVPAFRR